MNRKYKLRLTGVFSIGLLLPALSYADLPLTIESLTTDKGRFKLDTSISYYNQTESGLFSQGSSIVDLGNGSSITIPNIPTEGEVNTDNLIGTVGLRYGISDDWEIGIKANGVTLEQRLENNGNISSQKDSRLQDISLTTQYQLIQDHKYLPDSLIFSEISIYDNTRGFDTDSASSALIGGTVYTVNDPIALSATGTYQYNREREYSEVIEGFPKSVDLGDVFSLSGSIGFAVNPDITLNTGVGWRMIEGDKYQNTSLSSAKRTETRFFTGMAYALDERTNLAANLSTNISGDSSSTLSLGLTTKLGKLPPPISQQYKQHREKINY